jgi:hypothetical protein
MNNLEQNKENAVVDASKKETENLQPKRKTATIRPLVLVWIFGLVGLIIAIVYRCSKVKLPDGKKVPRYDYRTRHEALWAICIFGFIWAFVLIMLVRFLLK